MEADDIQPRPVVSVEALAAYELIAGLARELDLTTELVFVPPSGETAVIVVSA